VAASPWITVLSGGQNRLSAICIRGNAAAGDFAHPADGSRQIEHEHFRMLCFRDNRLVCGICVADLTTIS